MLRSLRIKNLALVRDLSIEWHEGFNVITGETGAGKSILLGGLQLVLGQRADRSLIRSGEDQCSVEAVVEISGMEDAIQETLEEHGIEPCEDGLLLLKRVITSAGGNRQFVNGSPTPLQVLADLGDLLIDMHGPHDHQSLLHPQRQLHFLDAFAGQKEQRLRFAALLGERRQIQADRSALIVDDQTYARRVDLLRHQVREIHEANLSEESAQELEDAYFRAANAAELLETGQMILDSVSEQEQSVMDNFGQIGRLLRKMATQDPTLGQLIETHDQATELIHEFQSQVSSYLDRLQLDPETFHDLENRMSRLQDLKRKYGPEVGDVLRFLNEARMELQDLESREGRILEMDQQIQRLDAELKKVGQTLTRERRKGLQKLTKAVTRELQDLGFLKSHFEVQMESQTDLQDFDQLRSSGWDRVEFLFTPNPGEPTKPLRAIASSGELSRVMLAIKTVLAAVDEIPVMVFDEIDANVGGETAGVVGRKMRQIGHRRQILCISHLAPVAASANHHFKVKKAVQGGRTSTEIVPLETEERVQEIARMLGGTSATSLQHARELLDSPLKA